VIILDSSNRKTRDDIEKLKREWMEDQSWDIYDSVGFEEYRDELMAFQKEQVEQVWEQKRKKEKERLESLICPLVTHADCKCNTERCAWWVNGRNACALRVIATACDGLF
jgi:hypothetical protein